MADWLSLGATALGGLLGASAGGDKTQTQSQTRDPWAPAQPYMLQNLKNEEALQKSLQTNPFNTQQTQGYSNLFGDIGNFRENVMPGLMDFANRGMTSNYQRQTGGPVGSGGGYGGAARPGGLMQSGQGPFSVNRGAGLGQNGLLDLNGAQNPYANGSIQPAAPAAPGLAPTAPNRGLLADPSGHGQGGYGGDTGPAQGGIGAGSYTDSINDKAVNVAKKVAPASVIAGLVAGLVSRGMSESAALDAVNASPDPLGMLNALQGWTEVDPTYDLYGYSGVDGIGNGVGGYGASDYGLSTGGLAGGFQSSFGSGSVGGFGGSGKGGGFGGSSRGGNDGHDGDSSHGTRG